MKGVRALWICGVLLLSLAGCSKLLIGASLLPARRIPKGELIASYSQVGCSDGSDQGNDRIVDYLRGTDGVPRLVERASSPEWVVITNSYADGPYLVFQAIQETAQPRVLWEYRVPIEGGARGVFRSSIQFTVQDLPRGAFRASMTSELNRCALQRVDAQVGAATAAVIPSGGSAPVLVVPTGSAGPALVVPTGSAAPIATPAPALPIPVTGVQGASAAAGPNDPKSWGYDGRTFKVGERILVDVGERSLAATVVVADGEQYFVRFDGAAQGTGQWVKPWRVVGRFRQ